MSPLRKIVKNKIATKTLRHQNTQNLELQKYIIREILCFCDFVAKKDFSEWIQRLILKSCWFI